LAASAQGYLPNQLFVEMLKFSKEKKVKKKKKKPPSFFQRTKFCEGNLKNLFFNVEEYSLFDI
jgi:hypothetical protein